MIKFYKYHGLGNDYIVIDPEDDGITELTETQLRLICHRNFGIGSDGVLLGPFNSDHGEPTVRIFNPDGSEAEKSGNGLRIFSRYLWDSGRVGTESFTIVTLGGAVVSRVHAGGSVVTVGMGRVSFNSREIPVAGPDREVINESLDVGGQSLTFCAATIGNPHCVILREKAVAEEARTWGGVIEVDDQFPHKTNVQFMEVIDRATIKIEIWERGAGYTLASGSSSSAAGAVARKLGLCDEAINVHMPGGIINLRVDDDYDVTMTGPVIKIGHGHMEKELFSQGLID
jgi:diaminopimelate epimerase